MDQYDSGAKDSVRDTLKRCPPGIPPDNLDALGTVHNSSVENFKTKTKIKLKLKLKLKLNLNLN